MEILDEIIEMIKDVSAEEVEINSDTELIDSEILDSFDVVSLILELNMNFDINIGVEEIMPENFSTPSTIAELVEKFRGEDN